MNKVKISSRLPLVDQIVTSNTRYVVTKSLDLCGEVIDVPVGCELIFKKRGQISNGVITGNATRIVTSSQRIFGEDVIVNGTWQNDIVYPEWFGAVGDGINDDTQFLQSAANLSSGKTLLLSEGKLYKYTKTILLRSNTVVSAYGATAVKACYYSMFSNIHSNVDIVDEGISILGLSGVTLNNGYRGQWLWLVGVNNILIKDCHFENHTPYDDRGLSQWCITVSGENVTINNCFISTRGAGLFSDGIHCFYTKNCRITDCEIHTGDDCISFTPEIPQEQSGFAKFNMISTNILVANNALSSPRNCIRFEVRNNAPKVFAYRDVDIRDISVSYSPDDTTGSAILLHDFRGKSNYVNKNFSISNIHIVGNGVGGGRNCIEIFGENPEIIPDDVANYEDVKVSCVISTGGAYDNAVRIIGAKGVSIDGCSFDASKESMGYLSIRNTSDFIVSSSHFNTYTPYGFISVNNSIGRFTNNKFERLNGNNYAGVGVLVSGTKNSVELDGNVFHNFSVGIMSEKKNTGLKVKANSYVECGKETKFNR